MSYRIAFDMPDPETGTSQPLILSGGLWHGDVFLYDFSLAWLGLSGRIECDWREHGPRFQLDQGDASTPRAQAGLAAVAQLLRPFFAHAYAGITDEQLAALYPGDYHRKSGYADAVPNALEAEFKSAIADLVVRTLRPGKVLDAGCAAGLLVREFHRRGVQAHGFDHCPDLAQIAIPEVAGHLRRGAMTTIPYGPEDGFDTLVCIDVFEHVPEDRVPQMVREIDRLGVRFLALHIVHSELEHFGHITLRPLSWWDRQLGPTFRRAQTTGGPLLALPCPLDPRRVLRIYQRVEAPVILSGPARSLTGAAAAARSGRAARATTAPR
ncbi:MAG: class I SAM-dependent methyltransferase [Planctomycetota bacterium]|nr:class I SAM-dependent methyltransferase [Planctomycetota bacterium]